ncbi:hypothetical protein [Falsibacillus pallidus]|uniref:hypothetical protein n=1 Tax=Falsibacillus pallidus TaxID=493781 RepID=UPI0011C0407B|nr:hypothetical protein [Falsibacillus pallidus]
MATIIYVFCIFLLIAMNLGCRHLFMYGKASIVQGGLIFIIVSPLLGYACYYLVEMLPNHDNIRNLLCSLFLGLVFFINGILFLLIGLMQKWKGRTA